MDRVFLRIAACFASMALASGGSAASPQQNHADPVASKGIALAKDKSLIDAQFEADLRASPETATSYGDYRFNSQLDDRSPMAAARQHGVDETFLKALQAVNAADLPEQERISHNILIKVLEQRNADFALKTYEMPLTQMDGVHLQLADLPLSTPMDSVQHYQDYISRLHQMNQALLQTQIVLRQGRKDGLMPVRSLLEQVPAQCDGIVSENPFLGPTEHYPASIGADDRKRLTAAITEVAIKKVLPAYKDFAAFIRTEYAPFGRTNIGMSSLPDGMARYRNAIREETTTDMSPEEIHALGLREVARITGLMTALAKKQGYPDAIAYNAALAKDPRYIPHSANQIILDFRRYIAGMQPRLAQLFTVLPKTAVTVEAIPPSEPGNASHYMAGTPDGSRPGRIVVATANFAHRSLIGDETIAYHEGIPGHHMQISLQQQMTKLPQFRRHLTFDAYAEGWAVYAEALGKEIGFFVDPASDFGRLRTELIRAVRLVIDTGIHAQGWTREQAVGYFRQTGAAEEPMIQAETDRYIAWPAQGLSYKIGQLKILALREETKRRLGTGFDLRAFHDEVLGAGSLPLDMLQTRIDGWIVARLARADGSDGRARGTGAQPE